MKQISDQPLLLQMSNILCYCKLSQWKNKRNRSIILEWVGIKKENKTMVRGKRNNNKREAKQNRNFGNNESEIVFHEYA